MVCDGRAMLCLESLMTRWRERGERDGRRTRSRSLCSSAADGSLLQLLHRRASSAISSASELISRRGVFSRRQYGSVEQLSASSEVGGAADTVVRRYRLENGNSLGEKDELFGPPSAPVLENPEFQTRWYFKYFLGKSTCGLSLRAEPVKYDAEIAAANCYSRTKGLSNVWKAASKCIIVSKKAMMYILPSGLCMYWCGSIFIDRKNPKDAYNQLETSAAKAFKNKIKIFIFPEGTRNSDLTKFLPFKKGAFALAISSQVPIIPVVFSPYYFINSEEQIFNKGNMIIQCLEPVSTEGLSMEDLPELIERVQTNMSRTYKELLVEIKASLPQDYPITLPETKID